MLTVVIISKTNWNIQTVRNVTSISYQTGNYTVVGDSTVTVSATNYIIRIMES